MPSRRLTRRAWWIFRGCSRHFIGHQTASSRYRDIHEASRTMTIEEFFLVLTGSFLIGLSGAMMPGPVTTMTINETIKFMKRGHGWLVGPSIATGHAMLEICLMLAMWFGASFIFHVHWIIFVIGVVGGAALIFFGILGLKFLKKSEREFGQILERTSNENQVETTATKMKIHPLLKPLALGFVLSATS